MAEVDKYISNCPSCDKKIRIPTWHDGKVKCPSCSDVWYPNSQAISQNNMYYTQYNMRPQRRFAMTLGDTIEYGFSMISAVIISILISGAIGYVGFLVITASPEMNEPILGVCFGIGLIAFSSIVFTSLLEQFHQPNMICQHLVHQLPLEHAMVRDCDLALKSNQC